MILNSATALRFRIARVSVHLIGALGKQNDKVRFRQSKAVFYFV